MNRMGGDSRKRQTPKQYTTSSISRAAWPAELQRFIGTNKAAQQRRAMTIQGRKSYKSHRMLSSRMWLLANQVYAFLRQYLITALLTSGILLLIYIFYYLATWMLLALICIITGIVTCRLLFEERKPETHIETKSTTIPITLTKSDEEQLLHQAPNIDFPETPMPSTPLVRVLETIDLSSSDVKHFIHTSEQANTEGNHQPIETMPEAEEGSQSEEPQSEEVQEELDLAEAIPEESIANQDSPSDN
jgi:hypothetical protein